MAFFYLFLTFLNVYEQCGNSSIVCEAVWIKLMFIQNHLSQLFTDDHTNNIQTVSDPITHHYRHTHSRFQCEYHQHSKHSRCVSVYVSFYDCKETPMRASSHGTVYNIQSQSHGVCSTGSTHQSPPLIGSALHVRCPVYSQQMRDLNTTLFIFV